MVNRTVSRPAICISLALLCLGTLPPANAASTGPSRETIASTTAPVPGGYESWDALWKAQKDLVGQADEIRKVARRGARFVPGYADITLDNEHRRVDLYWKGEPPADVRAAVASAKVRVQLHTAAYDFNELQTAARVVMGGRFTATSLSNGRALDTRDIVEVGPSAGGSGLTITHFDPSTTRDASSATIEVSAGGVSVRANVVGTAERPSTTNYFRQAVPVRGGRVFIANSSLCSTAFVVQDPAGALRTLTAAHCVRKGQYVDTYNGQAFGVANNSNSIQDVAIFDNSRYYTGVTYTRQVEQGAGMDTDDRVTAALTTGAYQPYVGQWICISPGLSGGSCGIQITASGVWYEDPSAGRTIGPVFKGWSNTENVVGSGDSGGPVFDSISPELHITALGVISGRYGATSTQCKSYANGRSCSHGVLFVGIEDAYRALGIRVW
ncbi:hypothetical protein [Microbispora amethystogenes]|uniref:hypothetical protein n=1 Tax=Microbispora amethystogenes TaxID=1427754 RepID=UPI00195439D3|nr:hypothetical protein [Microbispora amethystogenes]